MNPSEIIKIIDWHKGIPIVIIYEPAKPTVETVQNNWKYIQKLTEGKKFHMINDISKAPPPKADVRHAVQETLVEMEPYLMSSQVYAGDSVLLQIALKFIAASMHMKNFNLVKSINAAIENIKNEH